jgi:hypothetical protein
MSLGIAACLSLIPEPLLVLSWNDTSKPRTSAKVSELFQSLNCTANLNVVLSEWLTSRYTTLVSSLNNKMQQTQRCSAAACQSTRLLYSGPIKLKVIKQKSTTPWTWTVEAWLHWFWSSALSDGQGHNLAALFSKKECLYPLNWRLGRPHSRFGRCVQEITSFFRHGLKSFLIRVVFVMDVTYLHMMFVKYATLFHAHYKPSVLSTYLRVPILKMHCFSLHKFLADRQIQRPHRIFVRNTLS